MRRLMLKHARTRKINLGMHLGARLEVRLGVLLVAQLAVVPFEWVMMGKPHSATKWDGKHSMYPRYLHQTPDICTKIQWQSNRLAMLANLRGKQIVVQGVLRRAEGVPVAAAMLASHFTTCNDCLEGHGNTTALWEDGRLRVSGYLESSICGLSFKVHFTICDDHLKTFLPSP